MSFFEFIKDTWNDSWFYKMMVILLFCIPVLFVTLVVASVVAIQDQNQVERSCQSGIVIQGEKNGESGWFCVQEVR